LVAVRGLPDESQNPALEGALFQVVLPPLSEEETSTLLMAPVRG
jgi:hypothetical protein